MQQIKLYAPKAGLTLTGTLAALGLVGVAVEPGSVALLMLGSAMIAGRR